MKNAQVSASPSTTDASIQVGPPPDMVEFPAEVFRHRLASQLIKHVRPPTRRDLGTKVVKLKPIVVPAMVIEEMLSTARGMPQEDEQSGIIRLTPGGVVKPTKSTSSGHTTKIKVQDPNHIVSFFKMQEKLPSRCEGATRLNLSKSQEKRGVLAKTVSMAAAPLRCKFYVPKGKAATRSLPTATISFNRVHMDENAVVTFGPMHDKYPPWFKQRLRAEIYKAYIAMGQRHLPVDPEVYSRVRYNLADGRLCGQHSIQGSPMLSDAPPPPSPPPRQSSKRKAPEPKTSKAAKKARRAPTVESYEIQRIVREEGAWGGEKRWFAVEWAHVGYDESWEAWRNAGGEPGTPVLTWMPLRKARRLTAFREWEDAAAERAAERAAEAEAPIE